MQNVKILENQDSVIVPVQRWKRMQNEIKSLRKRLKKAELMIDIKNTLTGLKRNLNDPNYNPGKEIEADEFLDELRNDK
jgi:hypothetical protein